MEKIMKRINELQNQLEELKNVVADEYKTQLIPDAKCKVIGEDQKSYDCDDRFTTNRYALQCIANEIVKLPGYEDYHIGELKILQNTDPNLSFAHIRVMSDSSDGGIRHPRINLATSLCNKNMSEFIDDMNHRILKRYPASITINVLNIDELLQDVCRLGYNDSKATVDSLVKIPVSEEIIADNPLVHVRAYYDSGINIWVCRTIDAK